MWEDTVVADPSEPGESTLLHLLTPVERLPLTELTGKRATGQRIGTASLTESGEGRLGTRDDRSDDERSGRRLGPVYKGEKLAEG